MANALPGSEGRAKIGFSVAKAVLRLVGGSELADAISDLTGFARIEVRQLARQSAASLASVAAEEFRDVPRDDAQWAEGAVVRMFQALAAGPNLQIAKESLIGPNALKQLAFSLGLNSEDRATLDSLSIDSHSYFETLSDGVSHLICSWYISDPRAMQVAIAASIGELLEGHRDTLDTVRELAWKQPRSIEDPLQDVCEVHVRPVREWTAREFGVHGAVVDPAQSEAAIGDFAPSYVERPHDRRLRSFLQGRNESAQLILIKGSSCTGKTRTAFEALRDVFPDRPLASLGTEAAARSFLQRTDPPKDCVLWLDDAQFLLEGENGALIADALQAYLRKHRQSLAITTIWTSAWEEMSQSQGQRRPIALLLRTAVTISVPPRFSSDVLEAALLVDPALQSAWRACRDSGRLCQTLAAGPDLIDRWLNSSNPYASAIVTAVVDGYRLHASRSISLKFLEGAAPGYLSDSEMAEASVTWFADAWQFASTLVRGVERLLSLAADAQGVGRGERVRLAEYVREHGPRMRSGSPLPVAFWAAAQAHMTNAKDLTSLARWAESLHLYRVAVGLGKKAAGLGDGFGAHVVASCLRRSGAHQEEVVRWERTRQILDQAEEHAEDDRAWVGIEHASRDQARHLARNGDLPGSEEMWRQLVLGGDSIALWELIAILHFSDRQSEVRSTWEWGLAHGTEIGQFWEGESDSALEFGIYPSWDWAYDLAESGHTGAMKAIAKALWPEPEEDEVLSGTYDPYSEDSTQRAAEARAWLMKAAECGDESALDLLHGIPRSRHEAREAARTGEHDAMWNAAELAKRSGDLEEAEHWLRELLRSGYSAAEDLVDVLELNGKKAGEDAQLIAEASQGDEGVLLALARVNQSGGRFRAAEQQLRAAIASGSTLAEVRLAALLDSRGRTAAAEGLLRTSILRCASWRLEEVAHAPDMLADLLVRQGGADEAERFLRFGLEPDGMTSAPW